MQNAPAPNPMNPPPLPHNRQKKLSESISIRWFLLGLLLVALAVGGVTYLSVTSSPSAELDYELLATEIRHGTVQGMAISGNELTGDFSDIRQSYDGQVRGQNEPVPDGYTERDARAVTSFTATIPDGERENLIELAGEHGVEVTVE